MLLPLALKTVTLPDVKSRPWRADVTQSCPDGFAFIRRMDAVAALRVHPVPERDGSGTVGAGSIDMLHYTRM
jgi:hypothetical protein